MILKDGYVHGADIYRNRVKLDFSANVNPFGTPEAVTQAVCDASRRIAVYPDPYCGPLRERLAVLHGVSPDEIICGNGAASKEQVAMMIGKTLKVDLDPKYLDATDALAIALCHHYQMSSPLAAIGSSSDWKKFISDNPERIKKQ
jgi:histidinol-phosphate/aromatic aminotransferase/cobyric acid decarboxylase-like protein